MSRVVKKLVIIPLALLSIVSIGGALSSISSQPEPASAISEITPSAKTSLAHEPVVTTQTVTEIESLPFETNTVNDSSIPKGTSKITVAGVNGVKSLTYLVTYNDGQQTDKKLLKDEVTTAPTTQITHIGTYEAPSCPNGTYVNSAGNTVCSPYASPSTPAGATAICGDGSYSFSQSRSGTCSHHGGVAQWL